MTEIVVLTLISGINTTFESYKINTIFIAQRLSFYELLKFHVQLTLALVKITHLIQLSADSSRFSYKSNQTTSIQG